MPIAVTAKLDQALSDPVERLSRAIEARYPDFVPQPDYPPHITLAVMSDDVSSDELIKLLGKVTLGVDRFPVVTSHLGIFPGQPSYIFLAPVVTKPLLELHAMVAAALPAGVMHPHYEIGSWVPHITLAAVNQTLDDTIANGLDDFQTYRGHVTDIEVVRFPPVQVLARL